jgi:arylsulfatase A-like enzyme
MNKLLLAAASLALLGCQSEGGDAPRATAMQATEAVDPDAPRPNIVFVLVDDQRFDALGRLNPKIETPVMDMMAEEGVFFENAFVGTSLCSPSRATILTGRSTRNHRIGGNSEPEPVGTEYYPRYLQEAGYETALIGKWHMGRGDQPREGFDHWLSFAGQGNYFPEQHQSGQQMLNVNGEMVPQEGYVTDELTDYAIDWIENREAKDKPFFLHLAHKAVHSNFTPPPRHEGRYAGQTFVEPMPLTADNYENKPRWVFDQRNSWHGVDFPYYSDLDVQSFQRRYYETLLAVDDNLGRLISYLEESGQMENTVVFLMGDNGFMFGEQGLIDKRNAYEPSIRVPLIAYGPGVIGKGVSVEEIVANLDIAPTMLALAGAPRPAHFEGRSMDRLLTGGEDPDWKNEFVYEYYWDVTFPQTPTTFALRDDRYKYVTYHGIWDLDELYDLEADPEETTNLIESEEHAGIVDDMRARLYARLQNAEGQRIVPYEVKRKTGHVLRNEVREEAASFPPQWHVEPLEDSAER